MECADLPLTPVIVLDQFESSSPSGERVPDLVEDSATTLVTLPKTEFPSIWPRECRTTTRWPPDSSCALRNYKLLISLREDFLPKLDEWRQLIPALGRSQDAAAPLAGSRSIDAVLHAGRQPDDAGCAGAQGGGHHRRPRASIAAATTASRPSRSAEVPTSVPASPVREVEPSLLSLFCRELNEERKRRGQDRSSTSN